MLAEHVVALRHQLLEARKAILRIAAIGKERQLEPALIVIVDRLEKFLRVGRVNEHRQLEPRACVPDRIELRVVDPQTRAVGLLDGEAEALGNFADANRAGGDIGFELLDRLLRPAWSDVLKVDAREHAHAVFHLLRCAHGLPALVFSRSPDRLSADTMMRTFRLSSAAPSDARPSAEKMRPCGCPWKSIAGYLAVFTMCDGRDQRRPRAVVDECSAAELRRHAAPRTNLGCAGRACVARLIAIAEPRPPPRCAETSRWARQSAVLETDEGKKMAHVHSEGVVRGTARNDDGWSGAEQAHPEYGR